MKKLLLVAVMFVSGLCFAQNLPTNSNWRWPACPTQGSPEAYALGNLRTSDNSVIDESAGHLDFATPVYTALCVATIQYNLQFDQTVQGVILQMGSGVGATMEWQTVVDIYTPTGLQYRISQQFDKHTDTVGNLHYYYPASWTLPKGTLVVIRRSAVTCISDPSGQNCITGQKLTFVGK